MDIGTVFTQVWSTSPIWSTSGTSTPASASGTAQTSGSAPATFASTLHSVTAELQQFEAGTQTGSTTGTQPNNGQTNSAGTPLDTQATNTSDFGDQLGQVAGSLAGDALLAAQLYAAGPAALFV
ncbi:MAG: hypothetical protein JO247_18325 [Chloroflexi bacterium]|nr:hypothetical protein [Chloroflexota bacterium]